MLLKYEYHLHLIIDILLKMNYMIHHLLDNQNYETDQNHGLALKDKQNGPDEPKISNAANSKISSIYGTKISPTRTKIMKSLFFNLNRKLWDTAVSTSP